MTPVSLNQTLHLKVKVNKKGKGKCKTKDIKLAYTDILVPTDISVSLLRPFSNYKNIGF